MTGDAIPFPPAPTASATARATLVSALERLEETLDMETSAFAERRPLDLPEINRRKNRGLLELSRAARQLPPEAGLGADTALAARLTRLRGKLAENQHVLAVHLAAAQEVGAILDRALRDAESDGTYSARAPSPYEAAP